jgi:peptidoglycan/LPS O-acetylase OafA/YrhL
MGFSKKPRNASLNAVLIAVHRRMRWWRRRLALAWALVALCALVAAMHVPAGSGDRMDGDRHMDGATLCLAILAVGGAFGIWVAALLRMRPRPPRILGRATFAVRTDPSLLPPARADPVALQVLRL